MLRTLIIAALFSCLCATNTFHDGMSKDELVHYFGTPHNNQVPEYDLITPIPSGKARSRRKTLEYHVTALGEDYDLVLQRNRDLLPASCLVHYPKVNGTTLVEPCADGGNCYYFGTSLSHNNSRVAVSTCLGLNGVIITSDHELYIQPVRQEHTHRLRRDLEFPHIAYKRNITRTSERIMFDNSRVGSSKRRRRSLKRTVELMVVTDEEMYKFHGDDTKRYIMTAINIAAQRLLDESLQVQIHLAVVKLAMISDSQSDLAVTRDAQYTLNHFCKWQEKYNPIGDDNPQHADASALITRLDIQNLGNDDATGLAFVHGMCREHQRCSFNQDTGLDLGLTIAHELGHTMGMTHDGVKNTCENGKFIMSSNGGTGSKGLDWSSCSVKALGDFLQTEQSQCLNDLPTVRVGESELAKPGLIYDGDEQCRQSYGEGSSLCEGSSLTIENDECARLVCFDPKMPGKCTGSTAPRMAGTGCGAGKWCIKGKCVAYGDEGPKPVNGGWEEWDADWSKCSRTCGGGVKVKTRQCNNPKTAFGGQPCAGPDIQAKICNVQKCKKTEYEFKAEQCASTNGVDLMGEFYHWVPYNKSIDADICVMECKADGERVVQKRRDRYVDGTTCPDDRNAPFHRCVASKCRAFGCDGEIDSGMKFDKCGKCNGKNDTCQEISGKFTKGEKQKYNTITTIPVGATGVRITNKNTRTALSLVVKDKRLFNDDGKQGGEGRYQNGEVVAYYTPTGPESVVIDGPLTDSVDAQVWRNYNDDEFYGVAPDVSYEYHLQLEDDTPDKYIWSSKPVRCSQSCGGGINEMEVTCVARSDGQVVDNSNCNIRLQPDEFGAACNTQPCPPSWQPEPFGSCSKTCGGGEMKRSVRCVRVQNGHKEIRPEAECGGAQKPPDTFPCNRKPCPGVWTAGEWSACSLSCGRGQQARDVKCRRDEDSPDVIEDSECISMDKPAPLKECLLKVCKSTRLMGQGGDVCEDKVDCATLYEVSACSEYLDFMKGKCAEFCGFCSNKEETSSVVKTNASSECTDKQDCSQYVSDLCENESYKEWRQVNCQKTCGLCVVATAATEQPQTEVSGCTDKMDCTVYGDNVCSKYADWAKINCRLHCGICSETCFDARKDCATAYEANICTEFADWAKINCNKHCKFCTTEGKSALTADACVDKIECPSYGATVCTDYGDWAKLNCKKFCGYCNTTRQKRSPGTRVGDVLSPPRRKNSLVPRPFVADQSAVSKIKVPKTVFRPGAHNSGFEKIPIVPQRKNAKENIQSPISLDEEAELKALLKGLANQKMKPYLQRTNKPTTKLTPKSVKPPSLFRPESQGKESHKMTGGTTTNLNIISTQCNQLVNDSSGSLQVAGTEVSGRWCINAISVSPTKVIKLQFQDINVDCNQGSELVISEGSPDTDVHICKSTKEFTFTTSSNNVMLKLKIDKKSDHSYQLTYTTQSQEAPQLQECQQQLNGLTGRIAPLGKAFAGDMRQKCEIAINVKPQLRIRLELPELRLSHTDNCFKEFVKFIDIDSSRKETFCGVKRNKTWVSTGSRVRIIYHLNGSSTFTGTYTTF